MQYETRKPEQSAFLHREQMIFSIISLFHGVQLENNNGLIFLFDMQYLYALISQTISISSMSEFSRQQLADIVLKM